MTARIAGAAAGCGCFHPGARQEEVTGVDRNVVIVRLSGGRSAR